jgi:hypothetical protein
MSTKPPAEELFTRGLRQKHRLFRFVITVHIGEVIANLAARGGGTGIALSPGRLDCTINDFAAVHLRGLRNPKSAIPPHRRTRVEGSGVLEALAITSVPDKAVNWRLKPKGEVSKKGSAQESDETQAGVSFMGSAISVH